MNEDKKKLKQRSTHDEYSGQKLRHGRKDNRETAAQIKKNRAAVKKGRKQSYKELGIRRDVREIIIKNEDNNAGTEALKDGMTAADAAESAAAKTKDALYSRKIKKDHAKSEAAEADSAIPGIHKADSIGEGSGKASREFQKKRIRRSYHSKGREAEKIKKEGSIVADAAHRVVESVRSFFIKIGEMVVTNPKPLIIVAAAGATVMVIGAAFTSCTVLAASIGNPVSATTFTAYDEDILAVDRLYTEKEQELRRQIDNIPSTYPGYDEYEYFLDEIGHNPYELAAYLTVKYEDYKKASVREILNTLFSQQYKLTTRQRMETRTRTVTKTGTRTVRHSDGSATEEEYSYEVEESYTVRILTVKLENKSIGNLPELRSMNADEKNRYDLLMTMKGNKEYLFEDIYSDYDNPDEYHVPGSALSDQQFARMIQVGELFLGRPYVWGGSSPSTGFDCSGFVSYVLNHSGWHVGRRSAAGLRAMCTIVPESEAKPGDLIFFKGTYNTTGASHVGIYVGNGMMLHCGNPIQYTSVETRYWKNHFYGYGRLP